MLLFFLLAWLVLGIRIFFLVVVYFIILEIFLLDTVFLLSHIFMHIYMPTCTGPGPEKSTINIEKNIKIFFSCFFEENFRVWTEKEKLFAKKDPLMVNIWSLKLRNDSLTCQAWTKGFKIKKFPSKGTHIHRLCSKNY